MLDVAMSKLWPLPRAMSRHFTAYKTNESHPTQLPVATELRGTAQVFILLFGRDSTWPATGLWNLLSLALSLGPPDVWTDTSIFSFLKHLFCWASK